MKTVVIKSSAGIRNDLAPDRFSPTDLLVGDNIEVDETGRVRRRLGIAQVVAGSAHSLWGDKLGAYCVKNGMLSRFNGASATPLHAISGSRVAYKRIVNDLFWTDGLQTGVVSASGVRPAGLSVPPAPSVALIPGDLRPGSYLVSLTHVRADGHESGASQLQRVDVPVNGGFSLTLGAAPAGVEKRRVYVSECGGEVPMLAATLTASDTVCEYGDNANLSVQVRTQHLGPPPAGQVIGYYNGRLYIAEGQYLWYSLPYEYELFDLSSGYIAFTSQVRTFAPVSDGIFVGSDDEIVFLAGADPSSFEHRQCAAYGAVLGTEVPVPTYCLPENSTDETWMWASKRGMCLGANGGVFTELTGGRYQLPAASSGASLFKIRGGTPHVVTSLFA